jgi:putative transposase
MAKRDIDAAKRFLKRQWGERQSRQDRDGQEQCQQGRGGEINAGRDVLIVARQVKYINNNIVEQYYRTFKRLTKPMLNFKSFRSTSLVLAGIELINMIRKSQFSIDGAEAMSSTDQFSAMVGVVRPMWGAQLRFLPLSAVWSTTLQNLSLSVMHL